MKLARLSLENFMGYARADLDLAMLNIVVGANGAGKTTIRDAIEYVLTGRARGVRFKKDTPLALAGAAGTAPKVTLATPEKTFVRDGAAASAIRFAWSEELIGVLCEPLRLVRMSPADRQAVFQEALGAKGKETLAEIVAACNLPAPHGAAEAREILALPVAEIDKAEKKTIDARRAAKRALEEITAQREHNKPVDTIEIGGKPVSLADSEPAKVTGRLETLRLERYELASQGNPGSEEELQAQQSGVKRDLEQAEQQIEAVLGERQALQEAVTRLQGDWNRQSGQSQAQGGRAGELERQLDQLEDLQGLCVLSTETNSMACPLSAEALTAQTLGLRTAADMARRQAREAAAEAARAKVNLDHAQAQLAGVNNAYTQAMAARSQCKSRLAQIETGLARATAWAETETKVSALNDRIANGERIQQAMELYLAATKANRELDDRRDRLATEVEAFDQLAKLLGDGGPIRAKLTEAVGKARLDAELQKAWRCKVTADADGAIAWNGRPIEFCSYSEQWRTAMLVADLLCRACGAGFLVLDQTDSLDEATRAPLKQWAMRADEQGYQSLILMHAASHRPRPPKVRNVAVWWAEDGRIERLDV